MAKKALIEYDVALLLLRHGEHAVLRQLAISLLQSQDQLQEKISVLGAYKGKASKTKKTVFAIDGFAKDHAEIADQLLDLHSRYENRTFLGELRDVKRFLERNGYPSPRLKSRQDAKKKLFEVLSRLNYSQLENLREDVISTSGNSSLGVISDQILGRSKKREPKGSGGN